MARPLNLEAGIDEPYPEDAADVSESEGEGENMEATPRSQLPIDDDAPQSFAFGSSGTVSLCFFCIDS